MFAGEHTDIKYFSTVHGAYLSGFILNFKYFLNFNIHFFKQKYQRNKRIRQNFETDVIFFLEKDFKKMLNTIIFN